MLIEFSKPIGESCIIPYHRKWILNEHLMNI